MGYESSFIHYVTSVCHVYGHVPVVTAKFHIQFALPKHDVGDFPSYTQQCCYRQGCLLIQGSALSLQTRNAMHSRNVSIEYYAVRK